jgi:polyphenol oxidase
MENGSNYRHKIYSEFSEIGFVAGVIQKGSWNDQTDIYRFIGKKLIPSTMNLIIPDQVHGADIIHLDNNYDNLEIIADGVITKRTDLCLSVTTADCIPLVLADSQSGYFAAVHVGWRSFIGGIVENIFQYAEKFDINLNSTRFFIGPGIGDCCFEVGTEVAILFEDQYVHRRNGSMYVDLRGAVENKIEALGVDKRNIYNLSDCTSCKSDLYYSYRRDKETPLQMVTFIFKQT